MGAIGGSSTFARHRRLVAPFSPDRRSRSRKWQQLPRRFPREVRQMRIEVSDPSSYRNLGTRQSPYAKYGVWYRQRSRGLGGVEKCNGRGGIPRGSGGGAFCFPLPSDKPPIIRTCTAMPTTQKAAQRMQRRGPPRECFRRRSCIRDSGPLLGTAVSGSAGTILKGQGVAKHAIDREIQIHDVWPFLVT